MNRSAAETFVQTAKNFDRYGTCYPQRVEVLEQLAGAVENLSPIPAELIPIVEKLKTIKSSA